MKLTKKQLDSFHLLRIVRLLQKGGGGNKAWTIPVRQKKLSSLTSTQLVFFDEIHIQQVYGPPVTSKVNKHNIQFPRYEEGNDDVKNGQYGTKNKPIIVPKASFQKPIR